jgi:tetratricopeptide (TPR) repeat protein
MDRIKRSSLQLLLAVSMALFFQGCGQSLQTRSTVQPTNPETQELVDEADHACSYFYFLWARTAELAGKDEEALEAYEKALICDPTATLIVRKIPLLLARLHRSTEAIQRLEQYLNQHPLDIEPRMVLAKILVGKKKFQQAALQYRKVHAIDPDNVAPLLLLSELYLADGKIPQALYTLEDALKADSQSYAGQVLYARLLASQKEFENARLHYREALAINWSAGVQLELAEVMLQQKKYEAAVGLYKDILSRDAFNEDAHVALVHIYLLQNKEQEALAVLNQLKNITQRPERVDLTIARLYARKKEYEKAITLLSDVVGKSDSSEVRYMLAVLHFQTKEYENTLRAVRAIPQDAEEYEDALFLQVRTLRELKRNDEAIELLEKAVADERVRSPDIFVLLASLYQLQKQDKKGEKTLVWGIETYPDDYKLLYEYGLYLDFHGEHQQAIDVMQKVIKLKPEHAAALNFIGYSWADQKIHLDNAFSYIKKAVELKPENGYIRDSLGWVYYRLGKLKEAVAALEEAVKLSNDDPAILDHLGDVYLESDREQKALKAYQKSLAFYKDEKNRKRLQEKIRILKQDLE